MSILPQSLLLPQKTITGAGSVLRLNELLSDFGDRGILVHGRSLQRSGKLHDITEAFKGRAAIKSYLHAGGEPTVFEVDALRSEIKRGKFSWVAAVGGGSVIDLAKAAAALVDHPEETAFYQINPSRIKPASLPLVAAPTTAGTGSEATVVSVLTNPETGLKQSIRHSSHMPQIVILDPELLNGCPPATVAAAGLDAFVQALESYVSRTATPFTQSLAGLAIERIAVNLQPLFDNTANLHAATEMLEASYITGLAFSHSRLGVIHGLAHPLGVRFRVPHGLVCACCLPAALAYNREHIKTYLTALQARCGVGIEELVSRWMSAMQLANPFKGKSIPEMDAFISETLESGSTKANPREVTAADVLWLLEQVLR